MQHEQTENVLTLSIAQKDYDLSQRKTITLVAVAKSYQT